MKNTTAVANTHMTVMEVENAADGLKAIVAQVGASRFRMQLWDTDAQQVYITNFYGTLDAATKAAKTAIGVGIVYCVECGAARELDCICDDLNFADGERVVINGEVYARELD